jgi:hypothetical protein
MVSPLFVELFGGLIFLAFARLGFIYLSELKIKESKNHKMEQRFYIKALNDFYKNPKDLTAKEAVFRLGHLFYSFEYPDKEKISLLEIILDDVSIQNPKEKREYLINKDLSGKKLAA